MKVFQSEKRGYDAALFCVIGRFPPELDSRLTPPGERVKVRASS
jgi:hypothetical protein